jgi:hypothetical protein
LGLFEKSLLSCGIRNFHILGKNISFWRNSIKIQLLQDFLKNINTDYILVSDSADVVIVNNIHQIVKIFQTMNCQACFNAEKQHWPTTLPNSTFEFEKNTHPKSFLNAGLWISETNYAKKLIQLVQMEISFIQNS